MLLLPKDIQQSSVEVDARTHRNRQDVVGNVDLSELARVLGHATGHVTIVAGEQVARDDARDELERLRALLNARLATVPDAKDVSGCPDRYALGVTGVMGHLGVAEAITQGSACLLVGTRLPLTSRSGLDAALSAVPTLSIGSAPPFVPSTHVHAQDLRTALAQLAASLPDSQAPSPAPAEPARQELTPPAHVGPGVRYRDAMAVLDDALPDGADVVVDAGNSGAAAIHLLPVRPTGRFIIALGMGGMGYSFGAGIGMRVRPTAADRRHRGRRRILHARHGDTHRRRVPTACHLRAVQQQRPRYVRDSRTALLPRPVQLQPVSPEPPRRRAGCDVPGLALT